jgi:hypothetical protein
MTDRILIVTSPDDVLQAGFRILTVDLTIEQENIVSSVVQNLETDQDVILYVWKIGSDMPWLLDKIYKSNAIVFNADSLDQTLIGFLAAQKKSSYFGDLRSIKEVNKSVIFDRGHCSNYLNRYLGIYEQI